MQKNTEICLLHKREIDEYRHLNKKININVKIKIIKLVVTEDLINHFQSKHCQYEAGNLGI